MRAARVPIPAIRDAIAMMKDQGTGQPITEETRLIVAGNRLIWVLDEQELLAILKENAGAPAAVVLPIGRIAAEMRARLEAECTT